MTDHDYENLPSSIEETLKKASEEILNNQDGFSFTIKDKESEPKDYLTAYDRSELTEFINFDVLHEEGDHLEAFGNLIANSNCEDLTGDRQVLKILLDPGVGQVVPENSIVLIHYIAYISNLHEPFDVTYLQGKRPKRFTLGVGELIPGLEIGVKTMTIGENARFIIKPKLAYRELGCPPRIPPNATILFDVHLVSYFSPENWLFLDKENRDPDRFQKVLVQVKKLHTEGNEQYKSRDIEKAINKYNKALELLHLSGTNSDDEDIEMMKYLNRLYTNLSVCYLKRCAFAKVCRMGLEAMKYSERFSKLSVKLHYNWGKALRLLKSFTEARNKLKKALKLEPHNMTIENELKKLEKDKEFNINVKSFAFEDNTDNNECLPPEFWELFNTRLTEFIDGDDDVLTITLNNNPENIEMVKSKASLYGLKTYNITKAGVETNCIAIQKTEE